MEEDIIIIPAHEANRLTKEVLAKAKAEREALIMKEVALLTTTKIKPAIANGQFSCTQRYSTHAYASEIAEVLSESEYEVAISGSTDAVLTIKWEW